VRSQIYQRWELCIADDASASPHVRRILEEYARLDDRIKVVRLEQHGHISQASNAAFSLASGAWIALLDHDDVLREHALAEIALHAHAYPGAELFYTDEDKIDETDTIRFEPYFKPDWAPDTFRSQNYLNHLTVHRAANIRKVGGWRPGFEGSQDYDLNLRIVEQIGSGRIIHIPQILYHWRARTGSAAKDADEKTYAYHAGFKALAEHLARTNTPARVAAVDGVPFYRIRYSVPTPAPLVSIIIPTRDRSGVLKTCVDSILAKTTYPNHQLFVVNNESRDPDSIAYLDELRHHSRICVLDYSLPFNYSALHNWAVKQVNGDVIALLNNDTEVTTPDWLTEMVSHVCRPEVGCVGAKLVYPDGSLQHGGVILGIGGIAGHAHKYEPSQNTGYLGRLRIVHNVSAVTAACLLVRREVYGEVGGLEEMLPIAFNDVDFCLKVLDRGYVNIWTPFAELIHYESLSRGSDSDLANRTRFQAETQWMMSRWGDRLKADPYYSPNLTLEHEDFGLRVPRGASP
jgi:glycosyltransferase involved in cell wall biosynthesis